MQVCLAGNDVNSDAFSKAQIHIISRWTGTVPQMMYRGNIQRPFASSWPQWSNRKWGKEKQLALAYGNGHPKLAGQYGRS